MTHLLPPQMLRLFVARAPLEHATPLRADRDWNAPPQRRTANKIASGRVRPLEGIAAFLERARQEAADRGEATEDDTTYTHALVTQTEMRREERMKQRAETQKHDPKKDTHAVGDPFKTLFLARLSYATTERELRREFDRYGPIERIEIVRDRNGKSRGYAFILFERERDMRSGSSFRGRGRGGMRDGGFGPRDSGYGGRDRDRDRGFERDRDRGYAGRDAARPRFVREGQRGGGFGGGFGGSGARPAYQDRDGAVASSGYGRPAADYGDRSPKRARY
ncbi:hypothetical protein MBRA1_000238 [Malassezia brasiliensis]|uniref:RRM domain-containing protein n=1 Tax=Malassezia brasiliensis TaxID=1821822 RepID=A0AAF0IM61_9BASI|nr:hypothetical protein MBRA1_000238 [Malassezia brasiliensis]